MIREKIKLVMGTPLLVRLDDTHGEERTSKFSDGVEYRFNVTQGGVACHLYLPVDGKLALSRAHAEAGDEVEICKRMKNQSLEFTARVIGDARTLGRSGPAPAPPPVREARMVAPAPAVVQARQAALADSGPAPFAPMPATYAHGAAAPQSGFTAGAAARQFTPAPLTPPTACPSPAASLMAQCMMAAVDVAVGVESYAKAKGKALTFNEEDVRAMGISLHINLSKERY